MKIQIIPSEKDTGLVCTKKVIGILRNHECSIFIPEQYSEKLEGITGLSFEECSDPDYYIVLGGDGTIMRAAQRASEADVPLLTVNLGRIGYLAEVETDEIPLISALFTGEFTLEDRMMLCAEIYRDGKRVGEPVCGLNDAVAARGYLPIIADFELYSDSLPVSAYRADGIIVSTPTGSTAYAMAAGGPILDPALKAFCVVPMCPHTIHAKPIIFDGSTVLEIRNLCDKEGDLTLTVDGGETVALLPADVIRITRSARTTKLVRLNCKRLHHGFYGTLRRKMSQL